MKIKGIRHIGIEVAQRNFGMAKEFFIQYGGKVIDENCYDERPDKYDTIHTCKIQFEDGSIVELTTDTTHVAFDVTGQYRSW
jgi:hypothetical protein